MLSRDVQKLLQQRYYKPGETWRNLVTRVVDYVCEDEPNWFSERIFDQLYNRIWLPNSPCLANAGTRNSGLMACFVVGPDEDTLEHHVEVLGDIAAVGKRGGGCGFTGANIRPYNSPVSGSAHGYAYGPNNWAMRVSEYLDMISQGGLRKMALMYSLPAEHQDILDFIKLKHGGSERLGYNFNQSVFAGDHWMHAAIEDPLSNEADILDRIAWHAHKNGEPGLLFSDTINNDSPYSTCECTIYTTNPCGEQPLPPYGSCNLGSINISHDEFWSGKTFYWDYLFDVVQGLTTFLDNVGSKNIFPNDKFEAWYKNHRPIGIGIMGYADALMRKNIPYGSVEALDFLQSLMETIQQASYEQSEILGHQRGIPDHCHAVNRRNITTVSIAPTGSIAFIAECSHGIEPIFSPRYKRTDEHGQEYVFNHPLADKKFFRSSLNNDKAKIPTWKEHIDTQAIAQKYVDSGISKTINMLNGVGVDDVKKAMIYAWESGCKGITIYRDGSRDLQVLEDLTKEDEGLISCPTGVCDVV